MIRIATALVGLFIASGAVADEGDANIHIVYRTEIYRIRPAPGPKKATTTLDIVLHKDGRVEDQFLTAGPKPKASKSKQILGPNSNSLVQYKVVDEKTISRTYDNGIIWMNLIVKVDGKACTANIQFKLNPTLKEYEDYSSELGKKAFYQEPKFTGADCKIE